MSERTDDLHLAAPLGVEQAFSVSNDQDQVTGRAPNFPIPMPRRQPTAEILRYSFDTLADAGQKGAGKWPFSRLSIREN